MVILPGLSVDNKEDTGSQKKMGSHRGKQQKETQETKQNMKGLREKENLGYDIGQLEGCLLGVLRSCVQSPPPQ